MDYILFIFQDANFQSRSILVPAEKYLQVEKRRLEYELLKKAAVRRQFNVRGKVYDIDQLLTLNFTLFEPNNKRSGGSMDRTEIANATSELLYNAACGPHGYAEDDKEWLDLSIIDFCGGFNHFDNYLESRNMTSYEGTPINVIDGFLVLETFDGKFEIPPIDTVDEFYEKYYGIKK